MMKSRAPNRWPWRIFGGALVLVFLGAAPVASDLFRQIRAQRRAELFQSELRRRLAGADDSPVVGNFADEAELQGGAAELEQDDQFALRQLANLAYFGAQDAEVVDRLLQVINDEKQRWPEKLPNSLAARPQQPAPDLVDSPGGVVSGHSWISLGPNNANFQWNGQLYASNDSGRVQDIAVDPRDSDVVYVAASAGGLWKTYNFFSAADERPSWHPVFDITGNVSIGAVALDPQSLDTVYVGMGDPFDPTTGGRVAKSTDSGSTWTLGAQLTGTYPAAAGGRTESAVTTRAIAVDPTSSSRVLVSTEVGLFRSTDGGATFSLVALPTAGQVSVEMATWSIVYVGSVAGSSQWLVSGVYACWAGVAPPRRLLAAGSPPDPTNCPGGNPGDIWRSTDSGATWTSLRRSGGLPNDVPNPGVGRIALATGDSSNATQTVVYAMASSMDETPAQARTIAILRSTDGGATFQTPATYTTPVSNPTSPTNDCQNMDVGHFQSGYNLAVAVSPANSNHVILGGNLCGVRSLNGAASNPGWDNIAHWLPFSIQNQLPYVHADWHALTTVRRGSDVWVLAGTDGGIYASSNVFQAAPGSVVWSYRRNRGLTSHQFYSIGSGDPALGDPYFVFGGLQDNGTRFRETNPDPVTQLPQSTTFNQILGGDGVASVLAYAGSSQIFWASFPFGDPLAYCRQSPTNNCNAGGVGTTGATWTPARLNLPSGDAEPFLVKYALLDGDPNGALLTATNFNVFKINSNPSGNPSAVRISTAIPPSVGPFPMGYAIRNVWAAPKIYSDGSGSFRLYGAALSAGKVGIGVDSSGGGVTWTTTPNRLNVGTSASQQIGFTTTVAFPSSAANFRSGAGDRGAPVFLVGSTATRMADELTLVPDSVGHLFLTVDAGNTWQPFGVGGANRLPNVPVQVVKFDPADTADQTIYVGTDIGVYRTTDRGANWERFGVGFPFVRVTDLFIARNGSLLRAATYGRGAWEIYPNAAAPAGVKGDGDYDRNQQIDFRDIAAVASRLGTTPATSAQPFYDWRVDVVGSANAIDEADLSAMLTSFGGHP